MEELTIEQEGELRGDLEALETELSSHLETSKGSDAPVAPSEAIGRLSRMDAIQQKELAGAGRRNAERRLGLVRAALAAMGRGEYGSCRECEEPVGYRRLKARPETGFCLRCQSARER
ncbi:MAG: TraR/DksA C4-type zinc finger protein [Deltaproteobacteria bacterium]|nr:TraR/DksA C4-type zinc finger protein [Deltaproteobacteria bacterium]